MCTEMMGQTIKAKFEVIYIYSYIYYIMNNIVDFECISTDFSTNEEMMH